MDMGTTDIDSSQLLFRLAAARDHSEVKVMCKGVFGGRDFLPARYLQYLQDPRRRLYVAQYKGRVVALHGVRIIDGGNTVEGNIGRALPGNPGIFQQLRGYSITEWIMKQYPQMQQFRAVVRSEKAVFQSANVITVPVTRHILDLAWKVPVAAINHSVSLYQAMCQNQLEQSTHITRIGREGLVKLFDDTTFRHQYLPSGILVVEGSPLHMDHKSNIDIIMTEADHNMFVAYGKNKQMQAICFGTAIEMDVTMETLRYSIDYYGISDLDSLIALTMRHISLIPQMLEQSPTARDVYVALFLTEGSFSPSLIRDFLKFMSDKLCLQNINIDKPLERQFVMETKLPLKIGGNRKTKL